MYHEGLRLPICKLFEAGKRNELLVDIIATNVRAPAEVLGDVFANVTCNEVGERMLLEFMETYGLQDLLALSSAIRKHSEQATRSAISRMQDGIYRNSIQIEAIEEPLTLACEAEIRADELTVDLTGNRSLRAARDQRSVLLHQCHGALRGEVLDGSQSAQQRWHRGHRCR